MKEAPKGWHFHGNGGGLVEDTAWVFGDACVSGDARVSGNARVFDNAWVSGNARVSGDARVFGNACVSGGAWKQSPLYIQGTRHTATNCAFHRILIGCCNFTFEEWKENYVRIGKKNHYSDSEIAEYGKIIELFLAIGK